MSPETAEAIHRAQARALALGEMLLQANREDLKLKIVAASLPPLPRNVVSNPLGSA